MTFKIILILAAGIAVGIAARGRLPAFLMDEGVTWTLCVILLLVGIELGKNKELIRKIKSLGLKILLLPIAIGIGSIAGGLAAGVMTGLTANAAAAVGAGFGWYSMSAVILAKYDSSLGAIAFLSNIFREMIAFIAIPILTRKLGSEYAIALAGATSMDTTLPLIRKAASHIVAEEVVLVSFISGFMLSLTVPVLVPILYAL